MRIKHDSRVPLLALSWRMYSWWGIAPYDNIARIARWGFGRTENLKNALSWWPTRQVYLDASLINDESMEKFYGQIQRTRPKLLEGYVGAMLEFARFLEERQLKLPGLVAAATTAAPLTEGVRHRLSQVFDVPVYDEYRGSEGSWMAGECAEQRGLHVFSDLRRIEVVDADGQPLPPGQTGDLVITDLRNRVFPLIRYKLGDRGMLVDSPCPCGVTLPLMEKPDGRTTDLIRLPSGAVLAHRLMAMFSGRPDAVRIFQLHQRTDHSIDLNVVLGDAEGALGYAEEKADVLRERINHEVQVRLNVVDALPYDGAKTKYIISDVRV